MAVASGTLEAGSASDGSAAEQKQAMDVSSVQIMQAGQQEVGLPVPVPASEVLDEMVVVLDGLRSQGTVRQTCATYAPLCEEYHGHGDYRNPPYLFCLTACADGLCSASSMIFRFL